MWLLQIIPEWFAYLVFGIGVLSVLVSAILHKIRVNPVAKHALLVLGAFLISFGIFFIGVAFSNLAWKVRVTEAEKKVLQLMVESSKENVRIVTRTVEKIRYVREKQVKTEQDINNAAQVINQQCEVHPLAVELHNNAAVRGEESK